MIARTRGGGVGGMVAVPALIGTSRAEAETMITNAGLRVGTVTEIAGLRPGTVMSQSPSAGTQVRRNTDVNLSVVRTPTQETVAVPNVVGMVRAQAERAVRDARLTVGTVTEVDGVRQNIIASQTPPGGTRVNVGTAVNLTVYRRRTSSATVTVPSLSGQTRGSAEAEIRRVGLIVGNTTYVDGDRDDIVVTHSPAAGQRVARGTSVDLTLSRKRVENAVTVPNVVGMPLPRARAMLRRVGLQVGNTNKKGGQGRSVVKSQSPAAGSQVARGTKVDLEIE
jgi:serine/threonine-protein kinase